MRACVTVQREKNASHRSRVGVGMNRSARVKRFERSNGLDTALYKNYLYLLAMQLLRAPTKHSHFHHCLYSQVLICTAESTGASMERTKMYNLRNGSKGGFEPGLT